MNIQDLLKENISIATKELEELKIKKDNIVSDNIDILNAKLQEKAQAYVESLKAATIKELFGEKFENLDQRISDKETEINRYQRVLAEFGQEDTVNTEV